MNNNWHKKEKPLLGLTGLGGGVDGLAVVGAATKTYIDDVFSTNLWAGTSGSLAIDNGIDLEGEGGLVWMKMRNTTYGHGLYDTVRGTTKEIISNSTAVENTEANGITAFNSNGFTTGSRHNQVTQCNAWTYRKAKGFFDVVTWTGTGSYRTLDHSLGCVPGFIMLKQTSGTESWLCWHRFMGSGSNPHYLRLNQNYAMGTDGGGGSNPNASVNSVSSTQFTVGADNNGSGGTWVAYLFAAGESTADTARSVDFDGSNDGLSASSSDLVLGTGDFTVECWFKYDAGNTDRIISMDKTSNPTNKWLIYHHNGSVRLNINGSDVIFMGADNGFDTNNTHNWYHLALVKSSNSIKLYLNGVPDPTTVSDSLDYQSDQIHIGMNPSGGENFDGLISNVRVVAGTAVYTSAFRPPTKPLENITNTKLLCCNNSSVTGKTVGPTITATDSPTASTDSPFDDPNAFKFGDSRDQNLVKCGSYEGNNADDGTEVFVGFEPSLLLIKSVDTTDDWCIFDNLRGMTVDGANDEALFANTNSSEAAGNYLTPTSTGFKLTTQSDRVNNDSTYIYMAIRRPDGYVGKPVEAGTDVFAMDTGNSSSTIPAFDSGFPVDFSIYKDIDSQADWQAGSRLQGGVYLFTSATDAEASASAWDNWDSNEGFFAASWASSDKQSWMWKRGQGFDVVNYTGNGVKGLSIPHSMNAAPEMMIIKRRDDTQGWLVYHSGLNGGEGNTYEYGINLTDSAEWQEGTSGEAWGGADPTSTHFTVGELSTNNTNGAEYISYLFSSVSGISKVGVYAGSNSAQSITTGFQPRFVIIKNTANTDDWYVLDTLRGWAAGNDKRIYLNTDAAQSDQDVGAPTSTGFDLTANVRAFNQSGRYYIYYAHA